MSSFGVEFNNSLRPPHFQWIEMCHLISFTFFYILHCGANLGEQERPAASRSHALFTTPSCAIIFPTVWSRNSNPHDS